MSPATECCEYGASRGSRYDPLTIPIDEALEQLRFNRRFMTNVTAWERLPARPARYADFPAGLGPRLIAILRSRGTAPLFADRAAAVEAALPGDNVVITGTISGRTLGCYGHASTASVRPDRQGHRHD